MLSLARSLACSSRRARSLAGSYGHQKNKTEEGRTIVVVVVARLQCSQERQPGIDARNRLQIIEILAPCAFEVLVERVPSASLIPRGVGIATVVCRRRRRRRRSVHWHGSCSARHHGHRAAAVLQHCELRVLRHYLQHALLAFLFLFALSCLYTLAALALALLDLLDLASITLSASFLQRAVLQSGRNDHVPLFVHSFPF
jgi:hypothetical protein